jgi:hypothetical protein
MADQITAPPAIAGHGSAQLPAVIVDSYNIESRDDEGFIGNRATKSAFRDIVENWRKVLRRQGGDPLGDERRKVVACGCRHQYRGESNGELAPWRS